MWWSFLKVLVLFLVLISEEPEELIKMYTNPFNRKHSTIRQMLDRFLDPSRKPIRRSESVSSSGSSGSKGSLGSNNSGRSRSILHWGKKWISPRIIRFALDSLSAGLSFSMSLSLSFSHPRENWRIWGFFGGNVQQHEGRPRTVPAYWKWMKIHHYSDTTGSSDLSLLAWSIRVCDVNQNHIPKVMEFLMQPCATGEVRNAAVGLHYPPVTLQNVLWN